MTVTSFLDNVQGCAVYIQDLHSKIAFTTPSDALLTSLFIKYARTVPLELFDDLFSLFQHVDFRANRVTMKRSEDIMDHIAEQRRANQVYNQEQIKSPEVDQPRISRPPGLVAELVAEYLGKNKAPFHRTVRRMVRRTAHLSLRYETFSYPFCESTGTLLLMSDISQLWRDAAQRHLRRRIHINSQDVLRRVFQSPNLGPWVRELSFSAHEFEVHYTEKFPGSMTAIDEMPRLLSGILKRCPNITQLYLYNFVTPADKEANLHDEKGGKEFKSDFDPGRPNGPNLIRQLGEMKYLEHLWLHTTADLAPELWKLCAVLPRLQNLKSLSLDNWNSRLPSKNADQSVEPSGFQIESCPPPSLTHLSLGRINIIDSEPIAWIMSPQSEYSCTCLQLCLHDMFRGHNSVPWMSTAPILRDLQPLLRQIKLTITKLRLVNYETGDDILSVMEIFPSLRSLSVVGSWTFPGWLALPSSICAFHFHNAGNSSFSQEDDTRCLALIKASPSIRKIRISYTVDPNWAHPAANTSSSTIFTDTMDYCTRNNVEFSVNEEECIPNFLDLE